MNFFFQFFIENNIVNIRLILKQFKEGSFKTNEDKLEEIEDAFNIEIDTDNAKAVATVKDLVESIEALQK